MRKDPLVFLQHILESAELIQKYAKDVRYPDFQKNIQLQDAVARRVEIIGEAAKNIPLFIKQKYPQIEWKDIAGTRDILIHRYFGVSLVETWIIIQKNIPQLKKQIQKIIAQLKKK